MKLQDEFISACRIERWKEAYLLLCKSTIYIFEEIGINFDDLSFGEANDSSAILNWVKESAFRGAIIIPATTLVKIDQLIRLHDFFMKTGDVNESFVEMCTKLYSQIISVLKQAYKIRNSPMLPH